MPVIIETRTDAFAEQLTSQRVLRAKQMYESVRRPLRGIEIKDDTYATIKVITASGEELPLVDAGGILSPTAGNMTEAGSKVPSRVAQNRRGATTNYSNFIIQSLEDTRQEKAQIIETFGDSYVFFFGERPRILLVRGVLFNTLDFNWRTEFWFNYENYFRGTKLVEKNARVYLQWDDIVVEGYMLGANAIDDAEHPYHIPFSFQLFVTNHTYLSLLGDGRYPIRASLGDSVLEPLRTDMTLANASQTYKVPLDNAAGAAKAAYLVKSMAVSAGLIGASSIVNTALSGQSNTAMTTSTLRDLISTGLVVQGVNFLSILNRYYKNKTTPRPLRTTPLRSNIRDNIDEYIGGGDSTPNLDRDAIAASQARVQSVQDMYQMERAVVASLQASGIDATNLRDIRADGISPFSQQHRLMVVNGSMPSIQQFALSRI